jgi:hypothetical protein
MAFPTEVRYGHAPVGYAASDIPPILFPMTYEVEVVVDGRPAAARFRITPRGRVE